MSLKELGPYRILSELGIGGMGTVYLAEATRETAGLEPGTRVALKVIHRHLLATPGFFKRFMREGELGRRVVHPNVVRTYDVDAIAVDDEQYHYLVMEYIDGKTLRELVKELGRLPEELCRHIGREVCGALEAIHAARAVHRDLKPENILVTGDHAVKLMDLGVAHLADEAIRLSTTGQFVGSVLYAAPEQFEGGAADLRSDLYSLGLTLYELGTGRHPFRGDTVRTVMQRQIREDPRPPAELNPQLSPFYEEVVRTLLRKDPAERFPSATALREALEEGERSPWWRERAKAIREATKRPLRRIRVPRETALYGRDEEIEKLRSLFRKATAGQGQVVFVEGEAGIGKTRLVDEFVGTLREAGEDLNFLYGSYPPGGAATASGAFATAYREHFGEAGSAPWLEATPLLVPAFDALLKGEPTPPGEEPLTKDSLQAVFVHATRALAAERPTIVLIDDLHFAPAEGHALFAALALAAQDQPLLLLGTCRPGLREDFTANLARLGHATTLRLGRLGPKDLARLLRDAFGSQRLADELGFKIATTSDGNPYFVFEIIQGLREGQLITRKDDGTWATTQFIEKVQLPASVRELVQARIADLDAQERNLLDVAACCGFEFDPLLVGAVLGLGRIPVLQSLATIEKRHRLVRSAGLRYVFDHHQVQESLYAGLSELLRREYHAALADRLVSDEEGVRGPEGERALEVSAHYLKGSRGSKALPYLGPALDHLRANYASDAAVDLMDRALAEPGLLEGRARVDLLLRKADALHLLGRHGDVRPALEEAIELADQAGDESLAAGARRRLARLLVDTSAYEEGRALIEQVLETARRLGDRALEAQSLRTLGVVCDHLGLFDQAKRHFEEDLAICRAAGDRLGESTAIGNLGIAAYYLGRYGEAQDLFEQHLALARKLGDRVAEARVSGNLAQVYRVRGRLSEARDLCLGHLARARELGYRQGEGAALISAGLLAERAGDLDEAALGLEEAATFHREIGFRPGLAATLVALGRVQAARGDTEAARRALEEALAVGGELRFADIILGASARLAVLPGGDAASALAALEEHGHRASVGARMEARFLLWQATREPAHVAEAKRLLAELVSQAPEELRGTMVELVPLHRAIRDA